MLLRAEVGESIRTIDEKLSIFQTVVILLEDKENIVWQFSFKL